MPPLSLNEIKKNKAKKSASFSKRKGSIKTSTSHNKKDSKVSTTPWQKSKWSAQDPEKLSDSSKSPLSKLVSWGKQVSLFPEVSIPVPSFLLSKEKDKA